MSTADFTAKVYVMFHFPDDFHNQALLRDNPFRLVAFETLSSDNLSTLPASTTASLLANLDIPVLVYRWGTESLFEQMF